MPDLEPSFRPRSQRRWALAGAALAVALSAVAVLEPRPTSVVMLPIPLPVTVRVPGPVAPPVVAPPEAPRPPRAAAPAIDVACLLPTQGEPEPARCGWDDGLPAISPDGKRIARALVPSDIGPPDPLNDGPAISVAELATGRSIAYVPLTATAPAERAETTQRLAALSRQVAKFHPLTMLYGDHVDPSDELRVEVDQDIVRMIDVKTNVALVRYQFPAEAQPPDDDRPLDPDAAISRCHVSAGPYIHAVEWDPVGRIAVVSATYSTSPCSCPNPIVARAVQVPAAR